MLVASMPTSINAKIALSALVRILLYQFKQFGIPINNHIKYHFLFIYKLYKLYRLFKFEKLYSIAVMATTKSVKKLSKVGEGIAVFLTQEANQLHWKQGEYVSVEIDEKEKKLILKKVEI